VKKSKSEVGELYYSYVKSSPWRSSAHHLHTINSASCAAVTCDEVRHDHL